MIVQELCDRLTELSHQHGLVQKEVRFRVIDQEKGYELKDIIIMPDGSILLVDKKL